MPAPTTDRTTLAPPSQIPPRPEALEALHLRFDSLERSSGARSIAVAVYDTETQLTFRRHADRWFHAASTIKVAILLGVYASIHHGWLLPQSRLHVRNRFLQRRRRIPVSRRGRSRRELGGARRDRQDDARHRSRAAHDRDEQQSRDEPAARSRRARHGAAQRSTSCAIDGIDIRRGVEDERAFERGINNRVTADGLVQLLRLIAEERAFSPELSRDMLDILHAQEFRNGIPARLPRAVRVAHKTGEISTIAHDAGVVYPPNRKPYVIAILTEWAPEGVRPLARRSPRCRTRSTSCSTRRSRRVAESHRFPLRGRRRAAPREAAARRAAARTHRARRQRARAAAAALLLRDPDVGARDGDSAVAELRAVGIHPDRRARSGAAAHVPALRAVRDHAARALPRAVPRSSRTRSCTSPRTAAIGRRGMR